MRIVICDDDPLLRDMVEAVIEGAGHEIAGVADTTVAAVRLIEAARPDVVIVDLALGFNSDFDVIESALGVDAQPIVFSHHADAGYLARYPVHPTVVAKPDLATLEQVLRHLHPSDPLSERAASDRRHRPSRAAAGPVPTGITDVQAFFEAVNEAQPGDAMVSIELEAGAEPTALDLARLMRDTDRVLALRSAVRCLLPGGGDEAIDSLLSRAVDAGSVPSTARATTIVVREGETGAEAFERLKRHGEPRELPS